MKTSFSLIVNHSFSTSFCDPLMEIIKIEKNENKTELKNLNDAIGKAKHGWIILMLNAIELDSDFLMNIRENIKSFYEIMGTERFGFIAKNQYDDVTVKSICVANRNPSRFEDLNDLNFDCSIIVIPLDLLRMVNGFDERYEILNAVSRIQFLHRLQCSGYRMVYDKALDRITTKRSEKLSCFQQILYRFEQSEIHNGKVYAFNCVKDEN